MSNAPPVTGFLRSQFKWIFDSTEVERDHALHDEFTADTYAKLPSIQLPELIGSLRELIEQRSRSQPAE